MNILRIRLIFTAVMAFAVLILNSGCQTSGDIAAQVSDGYITVSFDNALQSRIEGMVDGKKTTLADFSPSEYITAGGVVHNQFTYKDHSEAGVIDNIGSGKRLTVSGTARTVQKTVQVTFYQDFPGMAVFDVSYTNNGSAALTIDRWVNNHYKIRGSTTGTEAPAFWSYQSGSYESRADWVLPLENGFSQDNYMGMNATDYGGGTPVVDIWRSDAGLGVGHLAMVPKLVSLPVNMTDANSADLAVSYAAKKTLNPGESLSTFKTFVNLHQGDYFATLLQYRRFMEKQGIQLAEYPESTYEPIWCAWGYERNFTMDQVYNTLPKARELGFKWAVLDDGWQTAEGDWFLAKDKYPRGDRDMRAFTRTIRKAGLRPKIWWAPLAVDPGTELIKNHPEYLLHNEDGSYQEISWWDSYYLCPAYPPVQEYHKRLVETIMKTWEYDGLKIDGQHLNGAPPCYNKVHNHAYPEESFEKVPEFFKVIYETALSIKKDAVVEICPCGAAFAFHTMPYMNQPVSSDPLSSWQIRLKGKTLKALMGTSMPYYGDHVELSDNQNDFAATVGIGGVIGTKFTWPVGAKKNSKIDLDADREPVWRKWADIYSDKMLSKGIYRGELYDLGFDRPEAHAVSKDGRMYYAFYADNFSGAVELRGLDDRSYGVRDYFNNKDYGTIDGPSANLTVDFKQYLLLEAIPDE